MDEIKETLQDEVKTPVEEKEITPEETPKTLEEQVAHIREVALAEVGRSRAETERAVKAANAAHERLTKYIKEQEDALEEQYKDEPNQLTKIQNRRRERDLQAELDEREKKLSEREDKANKAEKERNISQVATRLTVDTKLLAKLAKDTDGSIEAIEAEAQNLPKLVVTTPLRRDSGRTIGGGDDLSKLPDEERLTRALEKMRSQK